MVSKNSCFSVSKSSVDKSGSKSSSTIGGGSSPESPPPLGLLFPPDSLSQGPFGPSPSVESSLFRV